MIFFFMPNLVEKKGYSRESEWCLAVQIRHTSAKVTALSQNWECCKRDARPIPLD